MKSFRTPDCATAVEIVRRRTFHLVVLVVHEATVNQSCAEFPKLRNTTGAGILVGINGSRSFGGQLHTEFIRVGADFVSINPKSVELAYQALAIIRRICESKRVHWPSEDVIIADDLEILVTFRQVYVRGIEVALPTKEFEILLYLAKRPWVVISYEELYTAIWKEQFEYIYHRETVWSHIHRLRFMLKVEEDVHEYIRNTKGVGYSFEPYSVRRPSIFDVDN